MEPKDSLQSLIMENDITESNAVVGVTHKPIMKGGPSLSQEPTIFSRDLKNDSCSIVAFEMQNYGNSNIAEGSSLKVINLSDFIPTVCEDGSYQTVLVSQSNSNLIETSQTAPQQSQILLLASEPVLSSPVQDGLRTETIQEKILENQKYFGICRICANEILEGLPLFHNQGLTLEIIEKIHRCLPIKVSVNDGFPQHVCDECVSKLDIADDLFKLSIVGNAKLQAMNNSWTQHVKKENIPNEMGDKNPDGIVSSEEMVVQGTEQTSTEIVPQENAEISNVEIMPQRDTDIPQSIEMIQESLVLSKNIKIISQGNSEASQSFEMGPPKEEQMEEPFEAVVDVDDQSMIDSPQLPNTNREKREWHCNDCGFVALSQSSLKLHIEAQHNECSSEVKHKHPSEEKLFSCEFCDKNFQTEVKWKRHVLSHTKLPMQERDSGEKCTKCGEEFFSVKELQRHLKDVHNLKPDRKYECDICGRCYGNASGLNIHRATHSNETPYLCDICGKSFKHRANLRCHKRSHGNETHRHACDICPKLFPSKFHLNEHRNVHLNITPYSCTVCDKKFHRRIQLRQHKTVHNSGSTFECPQCGAGFNRRGNMTQHMKRHSNERKFSCKVCKQSFETLSEVVQHRREHTVQEIKDNSEEKKQLTCSQCPKIFSTSKGLEEHTKTHSNISFECELCNKQLSNRRTLEYHIRSFHTQERPFSCQFCSMSFLSREACTVHERLHTGEKPYTCRECNMSFRCSSNLAQHLGTHNDDRPWACDQCPKRFKRNGILLVHMRTHTGEKPFCCDICGRRFTQKNDMLKHQQTHTTNQNFVCGECHWPFYTRKELNKHRRTHHVISRAVKTTNSEPKLPSQSQALVISDNMINFPITILEGSDVVVHQIEDLRHAQILEIDPLLQGVVPDSQILTIQSASNSTDPQLTSFASGSGTTLSVIPSCSQQNW
ncbi:zinc finger protein 271-like [Thrips palmi]|uniref:Zinc finger protein 271-like n=1 Tax=Thrips palmi TaxID=161013 RepID=A0A6P8Y6I8_THRPL|nr:zinc finger protein 271-like [Thrips palmi]XP_034232171.1 zinc finger protein 271-like [Thrips palmi]